MINPVTGEPWTQQFIKIAPFTKELDNLPVGNVSVLLQANKKDQQ